MATNEWRGDARPVAQVVDLEPPALGGNVEFWIGGRPLGWNRAWAASMESRASLIAFWNSSPMGEFKEVSAGVGPANSLRLTARQAGRPFAVVTTVGGRTRSTEVQTVTLTRATGGTFTLTFDGQTTAAIAYNETAAGLLAKMEALSNLAPGDLTITRGDANTWTFTFGGAWLGLDVPPLIPNYSGLTGGTCQVQITELVAGVAPVAAQQLVTLPGGPTGNLTLSLEGVPTASIAHNANAATVQAAAIAAWGAGITVTGSSFAAGMTFTFGGDRGGEVVPLMTADGSGLSGGSSLLSVATTVPGVAGTNTVLRYTLSANPATPDGAGRTGFQYRFRWQRKKWPDLPSNTEVDGFLYQSTTLTATSTAAEVQAALEAMLFMGYGDTTPDFFGSGNVTVTGSLADTWTSGHMEIAFGGIFHSVRVDLWLDTNLAAGLGQAYSFDHRPTNNANVSVTRTVVTAGGPGTNEKQTLTQTGSSTSDFRLSFEGSLTEPIPYGSSASVVQGALSRLPSIGVMGFFSLNPTAPSVAPVPNPVAPTATSYAECIRVTGGPLGTAALTIEYKGGGLQSKNVAQLAKDESSVVIASTRDPVPGVSAQQRITLTENPWGGTFTLNYAGQVTAGIAFDSGSSGVQSALVALSNLTAEDLIVTGASPTWVAVFRDQLSPVPLLTGSGTGLKNGRVTVVTDADGGVSVRLTLQQRSLGPWHWDDPQNWSLGRVPEYGDDLRFQFGSTGPRWGITQLAAFAIDTDDSAWLSTSADLVKGQAVRLRTSGTLPTGLATGTTYYVVQRDHARGRFNLSATRGGSPIAHSGGSGTHEVYSAFSSLKSYASWTGWIGNTLYDADGKFRDYRPQYLRSGWLSGAKLTVAEGTGSASSLVRIDSDTFAVLLELLATSGAKEPTLPACLWKGSHADNSLQILDGDVGVGLIQGEVALLRSLIQRGGSIALGAGVTFEATGWIDKTRGQLRSLATLDGPLMIRG